MLLFCNIPVLICYFKREWLFGLLLSLMVVIFSYVMYEINIYIVMLKYFGYFITYILLAKRKEFGYLFFKVSAIIQGFFISFEYFMNTYDDIDKIIDLFIYIFIIYGLTFFSLYLFKLADKITSLYMIINKIQEENKLKNALFKLTHEIKNPIAVCKGYLDMINIEKVEAANRYIEIIKQEINRSLNIMTDFMEFNKIKINSEPIDMIMLLEDVYDGFKFLTDNKNIKLEFCDSDEEIYLNGDYNRLKQVLVNIIKNSIEAIEGEGMIKIEYKVDEKNCYVYIKDNGRGMSLEQLGHLTEMFYTTKAKGSGLGIALSNEIVKAHQGTLKYLSRENEGTTAMIRLPL